MRVNAIQLLTALCLLAIAAVVWVVHAAPGRVRPAPGVVRVGLDSEVKTLDPHATTALSDFRVLANVYEGLVRFRSDRLEIEPALAESWKVSDDGLRYDFRLRAGVRFHDGSPFDAEAVRFNLERLLIKEHPFHDTGPFPLASFFSSVKRIELLGAREVRLVLEKPFAPLLSNLAYPIGFMVSPAAVRRHGKQFGRHGSGTGPFRVAEWHAERAVVLSRNDDHWAGSPALERVVFRPLTDPMTRLAELRSGGIDVLPEVPADVVPFFRAEPEYRVIERVGPHLWFLILNARRPPFDDVRARRAVNYAVDKRRLVEQVLGGSATVAAGAIPEAFVSAENPDVKPYPFDPERARKLLSEAGASDAKLRLLVPTSGSGMLEPELMASSIQADLASVGLDVEIQTFEWNAYLAEVNAGLDDDAHLAAMAWMTNDPDTLPYLALRSAARPPDGFNSGWYSSPRVDELVERARRETDPAERARLYHQIDRVVHDDAPWLFVASWRQMAVVRERVEGLVLEPSFFLRFAGARTR